MNRWCRILGHRYWPDLLHCKRCDHCRGYVRTEGAVIRCTMEYVDGKFTGRHKGYRP